MYENLPAVVGDVFTVCGWFGGGVAGEALKALFQRRAGAAREIMLEEIERGDIRLSEADVEDAVAITYRYLRAAQEGAARVNLRLLAQVLCGQARLGLVKADDFLYYADLLTALRRDEILLLGTILRCWNAAEEGDSTERMQITTRGAQEALIPNVFNDADEFRAVADGLRRTGCLLTMGTAGGGDILSPSPLLVQLSKMVNFEAAAG